MPIPWLAVLQSVPWVDLIRNAPQVAEGAKKLWSNVSGKSAMKSASHNLKTVSETAGSAELLARLRAAEAEISELNAQMLASTALIKTLAEQNEIMAQGVDVCQRRLSKTNFISYLALVASSIAIFLTITDR